MHKNPNEIITTHVSFTAIPCNAGLGIWRKIKLQTGLGYIGRQENKFSPPKRHFSNTIHQRTKLWVFYKYCGKIHVKESLTQLEQGPK